MKNKTVIFDLDDTLVDTSFLADFRNGRQWKLCISNFGKTNTYNGVKECLDNLMYQEIKIGIVTSSVSYYAESLLRYHKIRHHALVCYHDTSRRKPSPDPVLLCMKKLNADPACTIGFGDSMIDAEAYSKSGILSCGVVWSKKFEDTSHWHQKIYDPSQILDLLLH